MSQPIARDSQGRALRRYGLLRRANVAGWTFAFALLVLAEAAVRIFDLSDSVAAPSETARALAGGLADGTLSGDIATTLAVYAQGLALAIVIGVALGLAIGISRTIADGTSVVVEFLRPIPAVALIPLAILWFGLGPSMLRFVVAYAAVWPIVMHTVYGIRSVDRILYDVAATSGVTGGASVVRVSIPAALPSIVTGIRIGAALALVVCVTAEFFFGSDGIGAYMQAQQAAYRIPELYAAALLTGLIGVAIDAAVRSGERRALFWVGEERAQRR